MSLGRRSVTLFGVKICELEFVLGEVRGRIFAEGKWQVTFGGFIKSMHGWKDQLVEKRQYIPAEFGR